VTTGESLIGRTLGGRYVVRRFVGRGGMGEVYEAEDGKLAKRVALKLRPLGDDPDAQARFEREARTACRVVHEHVVQILDSGHDDDRDYLVMEYVEGRDLREVLAADGPMEPARVIAIARQLLSGLDAIHAAGLVHRDIKPANVMLGERDFVKVMDFGVSKTVQVGDDTLTQSGKVVGTPQYMAPEQLLGEPVDHRADLYAAGLTLFAMLAGRVPFDATAFSMIAAGKLAQPAPSLEGVRPGLPRALVAAVSRALAKHPDARFVSAREMAAALDREPPPTEATVIERRSSRRISTPAPAARRARWPWLVGALAIAGGVVAYLALRGPSQQPAPAPAPPPPVVVVVPPDAASIDHAARAADAERAGKLDLAIAEWQEAFAEHAEPEALYHLGDLSQRLGRTSEATPYFARYIAARPDAPDRAAVEKRLAELRAPQARARPAQSCLCQARDTYHYGLTSLCHELRAPSCLCSDQGAAVCPHFELCTEGADCNINGVAPYYRCTDPRYRDYHLPGKVGDACSGFVLHDRPSRSGHLECLYCGEGDPPYSGNEGDACVGYYQFDGTRLGGTMYMCR
jgi:serine/threonine-protein kinase